jgi:tryptophanyl-tRNA synthetase
VPVGEDQVPHIEMCRELARRFNQQYCGVDPKAEDAQHVTSGGVFPVPEVKVGRIARLIGTDGKNKMSKSLGNAIFLSDPPKEVQKKCNRIFTGRMNATDPGKVEGNPLFEYFDAFHQDKAEVAELKQRYAAGKIGDGDVKKRLAEVLNAFLDPMRQRRAELERDPERVKRVLRDGTARANEVAEQTLLDAKKAMKYDFFGRELNLK